MIISIVLGLLIVINISILKNPGDELFLLNFWGDIFVGVVGFAFCLAGGWKIYVGIRRKGDMVDAYHIPATLKRFIERIEKNNDGRKRTYYFPVWEYAYNGEYKEHKSSASKTRKQEIGTVSEIIFTHNGDFRHLHVLKRMVLVD